MHHHNGMDVTVTLMTHFLFTILLAAWDKCLPSLCMLHTCSNVHTNDELIYNVTPQTKHPRWTSCCIVVLSVCVLVCVSVCTHALRAWI